MSELTGMLNDGPPVTPRPSASVLLLRNSNPWEVLMLRRPGGADFAPGAFVFPGGSVHESDGSAPDPLRAAALRELQEEAGITLGSPDDLVYLTRWITPELLRRRFDTTFYLALLPDGQDVAIDEGEIVDSRWVDPAQGLTDPSLVLVYATRAILEDVAIETDTQRLIEIVRARKVAPPVMPRLVQTDKGWKISRS
jgi:8-oxo-dGTP pyrophosphatase MutT (NUDIX family)